MISYFLDTKDSYINQVNRQLFIQKKTNILNKLYDEVKDSYYIQFLCSTSNTRELIETDIKRCIILYQNLHKKDQSIVIETLLDNSYSLKYSTIIYLQENVSSRTLYEMGDTQQRITNHINNRILNKIINIDTNQKLLIRNQNILRESMNQVNGNNYTLQINNYLLKQCNNISTVKRLNILYNNIVKKLNSYTLASSVLSSGEISVDQSMVTINSSIALAGLSSFEAVPIGKPVAHIAKAAGIYYINQQKTRNNENYYDMIDSVIHTEGLSRLSAMVLIKQLNIPHIDHIITEKNLKKYADYFSQIWRESQLYLIENKLLPLYQNIETEIDKLVLNITSYHSELGFIILHEFLNRVDSDSFCYNCTNLIKCVNTKNTFKRQIKNDVTVAILFDFIKLKQVFLYWKYLK